MKQILTMSFAVVLCACQADSEASESGREAEADRAALVESQTAGYAVPETGEGLSFSMAASMAAVRWAKLDRAQLRAWWLLWSDLRDQADRPRVTYASAEGASANLFDRSARDGFCVAHARRSKGKLRDRRVAAFLEGLND